MSQPANLTAITPSRDWDPAAFVIGTGNVTGQPCRDCGAETRLTRPGALCRDCWTPTVDAQ